MVRTILKPEDTTIQLTIPQEYTGKKIEITFLAVEELKSNGVVQQMSDFWNIISDRTAEQLHKQIENSRQ